MHHDNIEALRQEATRITQLEINILQEIIKQNILTIPNPEDKKDEQTFDTISTPKIIEVLEGEKYKLENLDMVLAIVGTMKSGKSTTINAIVGTEILPNRNAPMTAIPILIRHTKGQVEPKLVFDNYQPLIVLMQRLHQQIIKPDYQEAIKKLESDYDLHSLIEKIRHQTPINHQAVGEVAIFDFLKSINDLVRISPILDINFPFTDYDEIHELPIIEIEFTHLKEMESGKGRIILLDTPGPNEAGQTHLRPMLQDQLKKASAVLAVMDYTSPKSVADAQFRGDLKSIKTTHERRVYALVNKFDQKDRNGMQEIEVKKFFEGLVDKQIEAEQIFPVSSKLAYLSNRARHALQIHGKLPSPQDEPWVKDFLDMANIDEDEYEDIDEIRKAIDKFWKKSKFSNPLENVIKVAFDNAALLTLSSATDKSIETANKINNFLSLKETALSKTIEDLKKLVDEIQIDIQNVCQCETDAKAVINKSIIAINEDIKSIMAAFEERNKLKFDDYFKNGVIKQKELAESFEKQLKSQSISSALGLLFRDIALKEIGSSRLQEKQNQPQEIKIPSDGVISFSNNKDEAERFTNSIQNWINSEINQTKLDIESILQQKLKEFGTSYSSNIITPSQKTLDGLKKTLDTAGFTGLNLELPHSSLLKLDINIAGLTSEAIQKESHSRTRYRDSDSFGSGAKRFFGGVFGKDDWGRESYEVVEHEYKVDFNKMKQSTNERLKIFFASIGNNIQDNIKKPIEDSSNNFFAAFKKIVEHIRADLIQSLHDKEQGQLSQDELLNKLTKIKQHVPNLMQDTETLKKSLMMHPVTQKT